jgi:hypothetical protein
MSRKSANHNSPSNLLDPSIFTAIGAEDLDAIAHIQAGLIDHYQPANSEELFAIERIALARHSLLRTYRMESGLISYGLQKASQTPGVPRILRDPEEPGDPQVTNGQKSSFWMAAGFCEANKTSVWQFFLRYQAQTERFYRHAVEEFERLRRHRGRAPEQTVVDPAPEPEPAAVRPPKTEPARPPRPEPASPPTIEPNNAPAPEPTPNQQFVDPPGVPAPTQPAAVLSRRPHRASHRLRPHRVPRTKVIPTTRKAVKTGSPNAP